MAQQTKHTPLQWEQNGNNGIHTPKGNCIALTGGDNQKANAEMIVKAVNNHDKLVDMLKLVLKEKYRESNGSIQNTEIETMAENLLQSLKN